MGDDEEATFRTLTAHRKIIDGLIEFHHGRFVGSAGDSVLAEFASVVNAVECAREIQSTLKAENASLPPERRMEFRIGINLGDVIVDGRRSTATVSTSRHVWRAWRNRAASAFRAPSTNRLANKLALNYDDLGEQAVKEYRQAGAGVSGVTEPADSGHARAERTEGRRRHVSATRRFWVAGLAIIVADRGAHAASFVAPSVYLGFHSPGAGSGADLAGQALYRRCFPLPT